MSPNHDSRGAVSTDYSVLTGGFAASRCCFRSVALRSALLVVIVTAPTGAVWAGTALYGVRQEHVWIPMKDGVRLAADLFMPVGAKPGEKFKRQLWENGKLLRERTWQDTVARDHQ